MADIANITRSISGLEVALTKTALTDFATFAKGATTDMVGDMFCLAHQPSKQLFADMGARGVGQRYLVDPERMAEISTTMDGVGADLTAYGKMPLKNHSKAYVRDGSHGFFTTGAFTGMTPQRYEFVATFDGEAAKAVRGVLDAQIGGDTKAMRAAATHAASFGILYNDARSGTRYLTDTLYDMVQHAEHRVALSTKIMTDTRMRKLVAEAADRGVEVAFTDIRANGMHGNLVVADDSVYFGTAHMSSRALGDMRYAYRQSRELGIVRHDAKLAQSLLARLDEVKMARYTPEDFQKSAGYYAKFDAISKQKDRIAKLAEKGEVPQAEHDKLAEAEAVWAETDPLWKQLRTTVNEQRAADGLGFADLPTGPSKASARRAAAAEADARAAEKAARKADKGQHGFRAGFKRMWGI